MNINDIFEHNFADFSQTPPENLWNKIASSSELQKFNAKKRRKRIFFISGISFSILIFIATIVASLSNNKTADNENLLNKNTVPTVTDTATIRSASIDSADSCKKITVDAKVVATTNFSYTQTLNAAPDQEQSTDIENNAFNVPQETFVATSPILEKPTPKSSLPIAKHNEKTTETTPDYFPPLNFSHDTSVCRNSKLLLFVSNANRVVWNIGIESNTVELYPEKTTNYYANVTKLDGSDTIINFHIEVFDCGLYIPNAFTPNGDGLNDEFKINIPEGIQIENFEISIFEPSGRLVFHSSNPSYGWDGSYQGGNSPQGAYFYVVTYKDKFGDKHIEKGQLVMYR